MKVFKNIVAIVSVVAGVVFLFNAGSDIQLGFGVVLIITGLLNIQK